jgi:hypothetical protein
MTIKAKRPLTLHPLKFDEAVMDILKVKPGPKPPKKKAAAKGQRKNNE